MSYPSLSEIVLQTIDLYRANGDLPKLDLTQFETPLVVGSNNWYHTGRILFRDLPAFFATESEVEKKLEKIPQITDVVVISASGEKHAPIILNTAKKYGKKTFLISSSNQSTGKNIADQSIIMPKIREPYTYNTSTYFGYMLAETPELDLEALDNFLRKTIADWLTRSTLEGSTKREVDGVDFSQFSSFFLVIPDQFVLLREMFEVKFIELFGRKVARDIFSYAQMKHATTVVQDEKELFICFDNKTGITYGKNQINLAIYNTESYAAMMLVGYYVIGRIQESLPRWFDDSIANYCERAKAQSGFDIKAWVEA